MEKNEKEFKKSVEEKELEAERLYKEHLDKEFDKKLDEKLHKHLTEVILENNKKLDKEHAL